MLCEPDTIRISSPTSGKISPQTHIYTRLVVAVGLQPPRCLMPDPTKGCYTRRKRRGLFYSRPTEAQLCPQNWGLRFLPRRRLFFFAGKEPYTQPFSHEAPMASQKRAGARSPAETRFTAAIGDLTTFLSQPVLLPCAGKKLLDADLSSVDSRRGLGGEGCSHSRASLN